MSLGASSSMTTPPKKMPSKISALSRSPSGSFPTDISWRPWNLKPHLRPSGSAIGRLLNLQSKGTDLVAVQPEALATPALDLPATPSRLRVKVAPTWTPWPRIDGSTSLASATEPHTTQNWCASERGPKPMTRRQKICARPPPASMPKGPFAI